MVESQSECVMQKTVTRLADGRELIYFDHGSEPRIAPPDLRRLPKRPEAGRIRYDIRTGEWVVVAGHRQDRGFLPAADDCPLCPSEEGHLTEIPASDYDVVVFENRFPALSGSAEALAVEAGGAIETELPAYGRCEVICFASEHNVAFADLSHAQARLVMEAWVDRTRELSARPDIAQVFCFENRGKEIGVSQPHPHGQIYAYPFVTPRTARMLNQAVTYRRRHGTNLFDDLLATERAATERVVAANDEWTAFVPFAARWPYEVHFYPHRRRTDLTGLDGAARDAFVSLYLDVLQRFDRLFDAPAPYISAWHQAPTSPDAGEFAVHLELFTNRRSSSRLKYLAGTEAGMDVFSNDIVPEQAAARLRELAK